MNILIVAFDFKPVIGGVSEYTHKVSSLLSAKGHKIVVFAPYMDGGREFDKDCVYEVYRYDYRALHTLNILNRYFKEYSLIKSIIKKYDIDIVLGNHICANPYSYWITAKLMKKPVCVMVYGMEVKEELRGIDGFKKKLVLRNSDKVFCISNYICAYAAKLGARRKKMSIVYPGITVNDFIPYNNKLSSFVTRKLFLEDKKVILTVGRLIERKGQDAVIMAMPRILKEIPNLVYVICGQGPYEKSLKEMAEKYGVKDRVIFTGSIDESHKQAYYDASDIFVMLNRELVNGDVEGFGIVFLEAGACGKAVIGGSSGGVAEAIIDNQTGLLVNPTDINAVAQAIVYLLKNPDIAKDMGIKGRRMAEESFTWEKLVPKFEQEFIGILPEVKPVS